ncbi:Ldh family oxidoreductase [Acuticoccus sp.]|uniref:Ldh family oxidoreductase n=1 Tax=Acuticoccus sp. TaxID=1904378 RepID=UPI003B523577
MPNIAVERLIEISEALLQAAGASAEEAATVAKHCTGANLAGHDSHGIIQIPTYIDRMDAGHIVPGAAWDVVQETSTTMVIDANWGFGYVATERAMHRILEKAQSTGLGAATIFRQGHVGRLSSYTTMAAEAGMIGLMTADSGRAPKVVAPFGGREARLGTNPISVAVPSDLDGPLFIDMATSSAAAGKINLALARGQAIPEGWVIDREGRPTTDPRQLREGGALLPVGGTEGYKGYGLSVIVEILSGILTGLGFGVEPTGKHNDGCFMAVFRVDAFRPLETFRKEVGEFARYLKATPPAEGSSGVLYPGEIEHAAEGERRRDGIPVEDATWQKLSALAARYRVADGLGMDAA